MTRIAPENERRRWERLPLAIPVFVRGHDGRGKEFLEFATAVNVSAGGALVAVRRALPPSTRISLEIPSASLGPAAGLPRTARTLPGRLLRVTHSDQYHFLGVKFNRPLLEAPPRRRRKVASPM